MVIMQNNGKMDVILGGNAVSMYNAKSLTDLEREKAVEIHNKIMRAEQEKMKAQTEKALEKAKEIKSKAQQLDVRPINGYVLVKPYDKNPFEMMDVTESGLIIPEHDEWQRNTDSGEMEKSVNLSVQADVLEVSPLCKFCQPGDIVYYRRVAGVPIPFLRQGFEVVPESSIQVVVNEGLADRFEKVKEKYNA